MSLKFLNSLKSRFKNRKRINLDEISFEDTTIEPNISKERKIEKDNTSTSKQAQKLQQELNSIFNRYKMQIDTNNIHQIKNFKREDSSILAENKEPTNDISKEILEKLNQNPNNKALQELASLFK